MVNIIYDFRVTLNTCYYQIAGIHLLQMVLRIFAKSLYK